MNAAILLAGGSGSRMGSPVPKQYMQLNGRIMLAWAAGSLMESSHTDCIYIVAEKEWRQKITDELEKAGQNIEKIRAFADPGKNRQLSIRNALEMIASDMGVGKMSDLSDEDTVFIHDAARPFLSSALIDRIYDSLDGHDGVMPALPVKDTVYQSSGDGRIESLLDRSRVYSGQAPELFVLGKYYRANMDLSWMR